MSNVLDLNYDNLSFPNGVETWSWVVLLSNFEGRRTSRLWVSWPGEFVKEKILLKIGRYSLQNLNRTNVLEQEVCQSYG